MDERLVLFIVMEFVLVTIGLMMIFINSMSRVNIMFGVSVDSRILENKEIENVKKEYSMYQVAILIIFMLIEPIVLFLAPMNVNTSTGAAVVVFIVYCVVSFLPFYFASDKLKKIKSKYRNRDFNTTTVKVDTKLSREKLKYGKKIWLLYIVPIGILLASSYYNIINYDNIPSKIVKHVGRVVTYHQKTMMNINTITIVGLVTVLIVMFANFALINTKQKTSATHTEKSIENYKKSRKILTVYMASLTTLNSIFLVLTNNEMLYYATSSDKSIITYTIVYIALIVIMSFIVAFKVGSMGDKLNKEIDDYYEESDKYWYLAGSIYCNKNDPSVFVPKRVGFGSTVNFGSKMGKILMIAILTVIIIFILMRLVQIL